MAMTREHEIAGVLSRLVERGLDTIPKQPPKAIASNLLHPFKEVFPNYLWTAHSHPPYIRCERISRNRTSLRWRDEDDC